jgi:membrane protein
MPGLADLKQLLKGIGNDKISQLSAAFSYGAIFSIGPLLLVLISIVGFVYGERAAQGRLYTELSGTLGASTAKTIQSVVIHTHKSKSGIAALIVGIIGLLLSSAEITSQLQNSFNSIFEVVPDPKGGIKRTIYMKLKNVLLVLFGGFIIAASVIASAIIVGLGKVLKQKLGIPSIGLEALNSILSLGLFVLLIYLLYRTIPDVIIPRKIAVTAALGISLLFLIGKIVLGIIIGRNGTASAYGAAAALVTLLLWIYYSGEIIFIGAEAIKQYGLNNAVTYAPKKFNLRRTTLTVDSKNYSGRLLDAWIRGYHKNNDKK